MIKKKELVAQLQQAREENNTLRYEITALNRYIALLRAPVEVSGYITDFSMAIGYDVEKIGGDNFREFILMAPKCTVEFTTTDKPLVDTFLNTSMKNQKLFLQVKKAP